MRESKWDDSWGHKRDTRESVERDYEIDSVNQLLDLVNEGKMTIDGLVAVYKQQFDPNRYED